MQKILTRRFFIGANWKSNNTLANTEHLVRTVLNPLAFDSYKGQVVVAPVYLHIPWVKTHIGKRIELASQNASLTGFGAYTGEVSASHLKDFGIPWVILGHSERRATHGETNSIVGRKCKQALGEGLGIIACFGEQLLERQAGETIRVVKQ
jgi:triosephosphate isomerase